MRWFMTGLVFALALAACGGGGKAVPSPTTGEAAPAVASCAAIQDLDAFRYTLSMRLDIPQAALGTPESGLAELGFQLLGLLQDMEIRGEFVAPDRHHVHLRLGQDELEQISVGDRAWQRSGDGPWEETTAPIQEQVDIVDFCQQMLAGLEEALAGATWQRGEAEGLPMRVYRLTEADLGLQPDEGQATMEVWLAEDSGLPVRIAVEVQGQTEEGQRLEARILFQLTDINSGQLRVEPPD